MKIFENQKDNKNDKKNEMIKERENEWELASDWKKKKRIRWGWKWNEERKINCHKNDEISNVKKKG